MYINRNFDHLNYSIKLVFNKRGSTAGYRHLPCMDALVVIIVHKHLQTIMTKVTVEINTTMQFL